MGGLPRRTCAVDVVTCKGSKPRQTDEELADPLPVVTFSNHSVITYLLVVMDYFTKWPEFLSIPNQESEISSEGLVHNIFCRFGLSMDILSTH